MTQPIISTNSNETNVLVNKLLDKNLNIVSERQDTLGLAKSILGDAVFNKLQKLAPQCELSKAETMREITVDALCRNIAEIEINGYSNNQNRPIRYISHAQGSLPESIKFSNNKEKPDLDRATAIISIDETKLTEFIENLSPNIPQNEPDFPITENPSNKDDFIPLNTPGENPCYFNTAIRTFFDLVEGDNEETLLTKIEQALSGLALYNQKKIPQQFLKNDIPKIEGKNAETVLTNLRDVISDMIKGLAPKEDSLANIKKLRFGSGTNQIDYSSGTQDAASQFFRNLMDLINSFSMLYKRTLSPNTALPDNALDTPFIKHTITTYNVYDKNGKEIKQQTNNGSIPDLPHLTPKELDAHWGQTIKTAYTLDPITETLMPVNSRQSNGTVSEQPYFSVDAKKYYEGSCQMVSHSFFSAIPSSQKIFIPVDSTTTEQSLSSQISSTLHPSSCLDVNGQGKIITFSNKDNKDDNLHFRITGMMVKSGDTSAKAGGHYQYFKVEESGQLRIFNDTDDLVNDQAQIRLQEPSLQVTGLTLSPITLSDDVSTPSS